ncbi:amino acid adenylation domain-containing protein, partial [Pseudoalteromonas tunicata]|uniref:non-ribosomal peptide synthetase n=1 Tax=Pseudoalteromonas tunicata TaxID=314281 RepID=UPI00273D3682
MSECSNISLTKLDVLKQIQCFIDISGNTSEQMNLIESGLDSMLIMRLANLWRQQGIKISFAQLIENPTLSHWLKLLTNNAQPQTVQYTLDKLNFDNPFELTDTQYAYWIGRQTQQQLGGVGCHAYLEIIMSDLIPEQLESAWHQLYDAHPMLRAKFTDDGQQVIGSEWQPESLKVNHFERLSRIESEQALHQVRARLSHQKLNIETGHNMGLEVSLLADGQSCIHFDIDLVVADVQSLNILLRDLAKLYYGKTVDTDPNWSFASYLAQQKALKKDKIAADKAYWQSQLAHLPSGPQLPLRKEPSSITKPTFSRRQHILTTRQWQTIKKTALSYQVTPAMLLVSCYAKVLSKWSNEKRFSLNLPLFDRQTQYQGIENVVADFTNLLLLQCDFSKQQPFIEQALAIQKQFHTNVAHSDYSAVQIQRDLVKQGFSDGVSAPIVFACNLGSPLLPQNDSVLGELHYMISQTPQVWLDHQVYEVDNGLLLAWDAIDELFPETMLDTMFKTYIEFLEQLATELNVWCEIAPIDLPQQQQQVRKSINNTQSPYDGATLHQEIFTIAEKDPQRTALIYKKQKLNYYDLAIKALQIASYLKQHNIQDHEPIAVSLPRGIEQVCAVLGILAAGACYVPVGIHQPRSRRQKIHKTAGISFVVGDPQDQNHDQSIILLDIKKALAATPLAAPVSVEPQAPAYIIFTSGSTGTPKGVEMSHAATANTIIHLNAHYGVNQDSCGIAVSALDFDLSVYDIFGLLGAGGRLVLIDESQRRDAQAWLTLVERHQVNLWNSVPILLDMLLVTAEQNAQQLAFNQVMLSGDWIGLDLPVRLQQISKLQPQFIAMGGATEAAIWSNHYDVTLPLPGEWKSIPYGKPLTNQSYRVVDNLSEDCPDWVAGELWIGGIGLATGYRGDSQLTTEKFVYQHGQRWYKTGDLGRYWPDGNIEFLGRKDHQVKVRGHRIELGEVDSALNRIKGIQRSVCCVIGEPKSLAAALVLDMNSDFSEKSLVEQLQKILPDYMIPSQFTQIENFPLNANGKLDRKAIATQLSNQQLQHIITPVETEQEIQLATLWKQLLNTQHIGKESNFFESGGDSLIATQLISRLKSLGFTTPSPLSDLFSYPVLAQYAAMLNTTAKQPSFQLQADNINREKPFPLTEVQRAYWLGQTPEMPLSCASLYLFEFEATKLDLARVVTAWQTLVTHHEMLRAVVTTAGEQIILNECPNIQVEQTQLDSTDQCSAQRQLHKMWRSLNESNTKRLQDEHQYPQFAFLAVHYAKDKTRLGINFDYLTLDGYSIKLLLDQLAHLYRDLDYQLPKVDMSFRDYVLQVTPNEDEIAKASTYWQQQLEDFPPAPQFPLAKDPAKLSNPKFVRRNFTLPKDAWQSLQHQARKQGITPSTLLLTVYSLIIRNWSEGDHTLNLTLFDRQAVHPDINQVFGDFTTLAPVSFKAKLGLSIIEQAQQAQQQIANALEHKAISSIWCQRELARKNTANDGALPVVFTSTLGLGSGLLEFDTGNFPKLVSGGLSQTPQVWLDHQLYEYQGQLVLSWDAVESLFPENMLDDMFQSYVNTLTSLTTLDWHQTFSLALPTSQQQVRDKVNETQQPIAARTLHLTIFDHAKHNPTAPALYFEDQVISYESLTTRALQIASTLTDYNLTPGEAVAVSLPRGVEQIA